MPLPEAPSKLKERCQFPGVNEGDDAVHALYETRAALKSCEGKRAGWGRFYGHVRAKR